MMLDRRITAVNDNESTRTFMRDGASPTSPVLNDGAAAYTPGTSERRGGTTTYMHSGMKYADLQTNTSELQTAERIYDAFGNLTASSGSFVGPFGYGGQHGYQEDGSGLKLLGHRYYDPSIGRFLTRDPIKDGTNWYAYCENNPLSQVDPEGMQAELALPLAGSGPVGWTILIIAGVAVLVYIGTQAVSGSSHVAEAENTKGKRQSTKEKHQKGRARNKRDKGGEKGDKRRNTPKPMGSPTQPDRNTPDYRRPGPKPKGHEYYPGEYDKEHGKWV